MATLEPARNVLLRSANSWWLVDELDAPVMPINLPGLRRLIDRIEREAPVDLDRLAHALERELADELGWFPWDEQKPAGWRWLDLARRLTKEE